MRENNSSFEDFYLLIIYSHSRGFSLRSMVASYLIGLTRIKAGNEFANLALPQALLFLFQEDLSHWRTIFLCSSSIYFLGNVIFLLCGSGEIQPFNDSAGVGRPDRTCECKSHSLLCFDTIFIKRVCYFTKS